MMSARMHQHALSLETTSFRLSGQGNSSKAVFEDIDRAVDAAARAVEVTPQDHPDLAGRLYNLGFWLGSRFERTGALDDLDRAVDASTRAVNSTPQDHPDLAACLNNLGSRLGRRFEKTGATDDLNRQLSCYEKAWHCETAPPSTRIHSARYAADIYASRQDWTKASLLLEPAILLLPKVSPRFSNHTDTQSVLASLSGLASTAAAIALNAGTNPQETLRLLELGRGVIAGLLMDMRTDVSDLERAQPELADKFTTLRNELDSHADSLVSLTPLENMSSRELQLRRRREADREFDELLARFRTLSGFHNFVQPPTGEELMAAASLGPIIVVNTSPYRCDAFLIEHGRIRVTELPNLKLGEVRERATCLRATSDIRPLLERLWHSICHPCLEALGFTSVVSDDNWPHIWWIPTGLLSQFPLHAAGCYERRSTETVLDRAMSSYASSIKALLHGRRQRVREPTDQSPAASALLVAMQQTPGASVLPYAGDEVDMLKKICPSLRLDPVTPPRRKDDVLSCLRTCRIFHFAGHGKSDRKEPSQSSLLLEDSETNPLTVQNLRDSRLQENPPFLAYLSACSTGTNKDVRLSDEGIHLVSAFQLAGFRHVVGTLWEVSDKHCVDVARVLYETLCKEELTDAAVCRGLHQGIRALRDGGTKDGAARDAVLVSSGSQVRGWMSFFWVPYVHFGV